MTYSFNPGIAVGDSAEPSEAESEPWVSAVEQRVIDRVDSWLQVELDDRVIRIVEDKLREETERRAWRRGVGVF